MHVKVVPIQELEAWLLTDEQAIRNLAMNPRGSEALGLPKTGRLETVAHPKERLSAALVAACKLTGRRLQRFKRDFGHHRRVLLERLDIDGGITQLSAWQALVSDTTLAVRELLERGESLYPDR